eukprot:scaffold170129_cov29-Prasinocladus_malaysianus.AAC.1
MSQTTTHATVSNANLIPMSVSRDPTKAKTSLRFIPSCAPGKQSPSRSPRARRRASKWTNAQTGGRISAT